MSTLSDVDSRLFMPATAVVLKCAAPKKIAASLVTAQTLPPLLQQLETQNDERKVQRATLVELSAQLIYICIQNGAVTDVDSRLLSQAQTEFISCVTAKDDDQRLLNAGLAALANCVDILNDANRAIVYGAINRFLTETRPITTDEVLDVDVTPVLTALATNHPNEVSASVVSPLLERNYFNQELSLGTTSALFEALCGLVHIRKFRDPVLAFLFKIVFNGVDADAVVKEARLEIRLIGLQALRNLLENDQNEELAEELYQQYGVFDQILKLVRANILISDPLTTKNTVDDILYEISQIMRLVMKSLDAKTQTVVIGKYLPTVKLTLKTDLYFTTGLLGYLEQTVDLEDHFDHLVDELTKLSLNSTDEEVTKMSNGLLCSLFNKCPDDERHRSVLKRAIDLIKDEIKKHNKKAVEVLSWISKGLLVRGHTEAAELIDTVSWFF